VPLEEEGSSSDGGAGGEAMTGHGCAALLWVLAALICGQAVARADSTNATPRDGVARNAAPSRALVEQKAALLQRLLSDAPAAQRIDRSAQAGAREYRALAQRHYEQALALLAAGELAAADGLLSEALALMSQARRLAPAAGSREAVQRQRYLQLADSVQSLSSAYARHRREVAEAAVARIDEAHTDTADAARRARMLAEAGHYGDAIAVLSSAEHALLHALTAAMGTNTLEFSREFASPAAEFDYELDRNADYAVLVPIALEELKPSPAARRAVAAYVADSDEMREAARAQAARQDYTAALTSVRQSTLQLQRALTAAGLVVPHAPEGQP